MKRGHLLRHDRDGSYVVDFGKERESRLEELLRDYYTRSVWVYIIVSIFLEGILLGWHRREIFISRSDSNGFRRRVGIGWAPASDKKIMPLLRRAFRRCV